LRIPIELSQLGYDMETGRIVGWLRQVGETVARGDAIVEIETEKATVEMEALAAGTLVEIVQPVGSDVAVGGIIGWLDDAA
jgi:pyruvate/2-oxoglutarate dehydrogenase complex dihydrolipoamide acyltransferase (E2) component